MPKKVSAALAAKAAVGQEEQPQAAIAQAADLDAIDAQSPGTPPAPAAEKKTRKSKAATTAIEHIVTGNVTIDNCTHFRNSEGRLFPATEVLRRMARKQQLVPVIASADE